jgi:hypothetical protein
MARAQSEKNRFLMVMDDDKNVYLIAPADLGPPLQSDELTKMMRKLQARELTLKGVKVAKAAVFIDANPVAYMRVAGMNPPPKI